MDGLKIPFLCDATLCRWGSFSRRFEQSLCFHLQVQAVSKSWRRHCNSSKLVIWKSVTWRKNGFFDHAAVRTISGSDCRLCDVTERTVRVRVRLSFTIYPTSPVYLKSLNKILRWRVFLKCLIHIV